MSIRRNTIYNLLGSLVPLLISLVTIPIYLKLIGEERYGILAIAWLLLGYFGIFDLGLGRATAQRIAAMGNATAGERASTFWTALILNIALGIIGGLLMWPLASYFFENIFKVQDALIPEIRAAIPWLIIALPIATLSGTLGGALQGRQRFLEANLISVVGAILFQTLPLATLILWDADLGILLPAALCSRAVTLVLLFACCRKHIFGGHPIAWVYSEAVQLLRFGGWITVTAVVSPMMRILDRFIIGATTGAKAVSHYTIPFTLGERSNIVAQALTSALFPRFATVSVREEQRLAHEGLSTLVVVMTPMIAIGIFAIEPFLSWWISPAFADHSAPAGQVLLLGFWLKSLSLIPYAQLQARGRPDLVAKCYLIELLPYLALLYAGMTYIGLVGAAIAYCLRVLFDFVLLAKLAGALRQTLAMTYLPVILLSTAFLIATRQDAGSGYWIAQIAVYLVIILVWCWLKAPEYLRDLVSTVLGNIKSRTAKYQGAGGNK